MLHRPQDDPNLSERSLLSRLKSLRINDLWGVEDGFRACVPQVIDSKPKVPSKIDCKSLADLSLTKAGAVADWEQVAIRTSPRAQGIADALGYFATERAYRDFHLSLRFKCEADGNSGVYIHTAFEGDTPRIVAGRQIEIDRALGHRTGGIYGDGKGWIAWPAPQFEAVIRPCDWNDMLIEVEGNRYVVHLNGIRVLDFTYPSPGAEEGLIALQLHSGGEGRMRFKDIFVRDLGGK